MGRRSTLRHANLFSLNPEEADPLEALRHLLVEETYLALKDGSAAAIARLLQIDENGGNAPTIRVPSISIFKRDVAEALIQELEAAKLASISRVHSGGRPLLAPNNFDEERR